MSLEVKLISRYSKFGKKGETIFQKIIPGEHNLTSVIFENSQRYN